MYICAGRTYTVQWGFKACNRLSVCRRRTYNGCCPFFSPDEALTNLPSISLTRSCSCTKMAAILAMTATKIIYLTMILTCKGTPLIFYKHPETLSYQFLVKEILCQNALTVLIIFSNWLSVPKIFPNHIYIILYF